MKSLFILGRGRKAAAIALAAGTAIGATALAPAAHAQRQPREQRQNRAAGELSREFLAAVQPIDQASRQEGADAAALATQVKGVLAVAKSADELNTLGGLAYNIGTRANDTGLQRQGLDMMLRSGKVASENLGRYNLAAGQLAYQAQDWAAARTYLEAAHANGRIEAQPLIAESYFAQNNPTEGARYLRQAIQARIDAGQTVDESWIKRGLAQSYNANLTNEAADYSLLLVRYYPSTDSWGDAIAILRNTAQLDDHATLDLMRLAARANAMRNERDYVDYIEAADARRLPAEVARVLAAGVSAGKIHANSTFFNEARTIANGRLAADRSDLAGSERIARGANATAAEVTGAADSFLANEQPAKAEELYRIALTKPGADTARVLTRLGIAQEYQGKHAEAQATFARVEGARQAIARLWSLYAEKAAAPATPAAQ